MNKDALIAEIGRMIVTDPKVDKLPWDQFSLVAFYGDRIRKLNGFSYVGDESAKPATPQSSNIGERIDELREATRVEGKDRWTACVIRIDRASKKITLDFEYDAPEQWEVTPTSMAEVATRARAQPN